MPLLLHPISILSYALHLPRILTVYSLTGSFFGSTPAGITWYTRTFYEAHDHYPSAAPPVSPSLPLHRHAPPSSSFYPVPSSSPLQPFHFIGKDQTFINTSSSCTPPASSASLLLYACLSSPTAPHSFPQDHPPNDSHLYAVGFTQVFASFHRPERAHGAEVAPRALPVVARNVGGAAGDGEGEGVGYYEELEGESVVEALAVVDEVG